MVKKTFFPDDYNAFIAYIYLFLPYPFAIRLAFSGFWWFLFVAPAVSYVLYATVCNRYTFRYISIKNGYIIASPCYTPIEPIQHKCKVKLSEIVFADFGFVQGDSKGNYITRSWDTPCVALTLSNESVERIVFCGYSKAKIKEIEKALIAANSEILIDHNSDRITKL